jgi:hypothetical protein
MTCSLVVVEDGGVRALLVGVCQTIRERYHDVGEDECVTE